MDDIVRQAMAKWPHVPDCFGWLGLDARGNWYMRDDHAQALGPFAGGTRLAKGSLLTHEKLVAFIERNYAADDQGRWYFQNGPQRVYVELEATPWVWRVQEDYAVEAHTGQTTVVKHCLLDEHGWLYLETTLGIGLVHTQDVAIAAQALEAGVWSAHPVQRLDLPGRYGFVTSPFDNQKLLQKF